MAFLKMMATLFGASIARISLAEQAWTAGLILCPMIMAAVVVFENSRDQP